jgi:uncharacterized protein (DUF305 family)
VRIRLLAVAAVALAAIAAGCGGGSDAATFDRAFIDGMVPHHEGAIEMARAAKEAGLTQAELIQIADAIIATQQAEIDRMKEWRGDWFGSSEIDPDGAAALGLSEAEMGMQHDVSALESAGDVDAAFASMMIDHHNGAVAMARLAEDRAEHDEIRRPAGEIIAA